MRRYLLCSSSGVNRFVTRLFRTWALMVQKWAVLPLSAMAMVSSERDVGGPT